MIRNLNSVIKKQKYFFFSLYSNVPDHVDMAGNFQTTSEYAKQFLPSAIFVTRKIRVGEIVWLNIRVGEIVWPNNVWRGHIRNSDMSLPASNPSRISVEEMSTIGASMTSML